MLRFLIAVFLTVAAAVAAFTQPAKADTYTYDAYGRLISVSFSAGGSVTYTYDAAGNRTVEYKSP